MRLRHLGRALPATLAALIAACSQSAPDHADPMHAIAIGYVRGTLQAGFTVQGDFTLPRVRRNHGWYAQWFTYTAPPSRDLPDPPYVQTGLVRSPGASAALQPFVALRRRGKDAELRTLGVVPDGPHRLALALRGGTLVFSLDGKPLVRAAGADFFAPTATDPYLQVGQELSASHDVAAGTIANVRFAATGHAPTRPFANVALDCYFFGNGVSLASFGNALVASGSFDPHKRDLARCTS